MTRIPSLPKLHGADIELGNFILGGGGPGTSGHDASRALLREIDGYPTARVSCRCRACSGDAPGWGQSWGQGWNGGWGQGKNQGCSGGSGGGSTCLSSDWGRKFLATNGGCAYIDLDHLELCTPETLDPLDHVACWHAMLRVARQALRDANQAQPRGAVLQVLVNNSDRQGNSYGSHVNFQLTRRAWENLVNRRLHYLTYLASFQVSSIVFTGQGKVGSENGAPPAKFQLSQRADFFEQLSGPQTTFHRPLVNTRDEPLSGQDRRRSVDARGLEETMARLHVIFFDSTLGHASLLLKVGVTAIVLAMIEAEKVNHRLLLEDPLRALAAWSRDVRLRHRERTCPGRAVTAVELQLLFLEDARRFVARGGCEGVVPRAEEILNLWEETLHWLRAGELGRLAGRLDWVLKYSLLRRVLEQHPEMNWKSPEIRHLDLVYSSLDEDEGLYWACERAGAVERLVSDEDIRRFVLEPPPETRAWTRAMLLRCAGPDRVVGAGWDFVRVRTGDASWSPVRTLELNDPLGFTRACWEQVQDPQAQLDDILDALELAADPRGGRHKAGGAS